MKHIKKIGGKILRAIETEYYSDDDEWGSNLSNLDLGNRTCDKCGQTNHITDNCNKNIANYNYRKTPVIYDQNEHGTYYPNQRFNRTTSNDTVPFSYRQHNGIEHLNRYGNQLTSATRKRSPTRTVNEPSRSLQSTQATSDLAPQGKCTLSNAKIQILKGDLTKQKVDVIVVCSSSELLIESVLQAAGSDIRRAYETRKGSVDDFQSFSILCPNLPCEQILFLKWTPCQQPALLEQTIQDFIAKAIEYVLQQNYTSIAFPAIGCGRIGFDIEFIAQTMINHVKMEKYPLDITFVIHPKAQETLDAFQSAYVSISPIHTLPDKPVDASNYGNLLLPIKTGTIEYNIIVNEFNKTMAGQYHKIIQIEHIQNERWHEQYIIQRNDFKKQLKMNTEKFLYHGCSDTAANNIMQKNFDRGFAGQHGTLYGKGVYFSSKAGYSHSFATPNKHGERCMFFARVLIGYTTLGSETMNVCPPNYHSTTDGEHIFVIFHDAQAYGQYLIRYQ